MDGRDGAGPREGRPASSSERAPAAAAAAAAAGLGEDELRYVEELAYGFQRMGIGRMESRVLAWLLICDPPEQHAAQIAAGLQASRGAISTAVRALLLAHMIERVPRPGDRRDYYRFPEGAWESLFVAQLRETDAVRRILVRGLELLRDAPPARRERLQEWSDVLEWSVQEFPKLMESMAGFRRDRQRARHKEHDDA